MIWNYREYRGANDSVAPHHGGYWIADIPDLDLIARVWPDTAAGVWMVDVTEANEVDYNGTPCIREDAASCDEAKQRAERYVEVVR